MGGVSDNALVVIDQSHIIPRVAMDMPPLRTNTVDPASYHLRL